MVDIIVPSGAKVNIADGSFEDATALHDSIDLALLTHNINLGTLLSSYFKMLADKREAGITEIFYSDILQIEGMSKAIMVIKSSKEVRANVFKCLVRSTYNDAKIVPAIFDDVKAREDYMNILIGVIKINLAPFYSFLL